MSAADTDLQFSADQDVMEFTTPLDQTLLIKRLTVHEAISEPYLMVADAICASPSIDFAQILGEKVSIHCRLSSESSRYFTGYVSRIRQGETTPSVADHEVTAYRIEIRPAFWFMNHTQNCRIFKDLSVQGILEEIFRERQALEFEFQFDLRPGTAATDAIEYCVQYNESDFDFCSRKMEEAGVGYYFVHAENGHKLVVFDRWAQHNPCESDAEARFWPVASEENEELDIPRVMKFDVAHSFHAGSYAATDFDPEDPGKTENPGEKLLASTTLPKESIGSKDDFEIFRFPGGYKDQSGRGQELTDQFSCMGQQRSYDATAESSCIGFTTGFTFDLTDHPREDFNNSYLLTRVDHEIIQPISVLGETGIPVKYVGRAGLLPYGEGAIPFVPEQKTPRPKIEGIQTAVVVTDQMASSIDVDELGRILVKFPWDRSPDTTSARVRVSQTEAGKGWGTMAIPHAGHEVLVAFLNGDPDQPIVVGRVYNAANPPAKNALDHTSRTELRVHQGVSIQIEGGSSPNIGSL